MTAPAPDLVTPAARLQASRAHIRAVLLEAQNADDSLLNTLLKPLATERPLTLAALAALLGAVLVSVKPWRWRSWPPSWMAWVSTAMTLWTQSRSHKD